MKTSTTLKPTKWLANRMGLSVSTIEKLRSQTSPDLPRPVMIGTAIRYDESYVEWWLLSRTDPTVAPYSQWRVENSDKF